MTYFRDKLKNTHLNNCISKIFNGNIQQLNFLLIENSPHIILNISNDINFQYFLLNLDNQEIQLMELPENLLKAPIIGTNINKLYFGIYDDTQVNKPKEILEYDIIQEKTNILKEKINFFTHNLFSPIHYPKLNKYFKSFEEFFVNKWNICIDHAIEYLELENKVIFSYYICGDQKKNSILVTDKNFRILLKDELIENKKLGYLTFQVYQNFLVYIKNKNELKVYEIS